jgi:hypothetical protein
MVVDPTFTYPTCHERRARATEQPDATERPTGKKTKRTQSHTHPDPFPVEAITPPSHLPTSPRRRRRRRCGLRWRRPASLRHLRRPLPPRKRHPRSGGARRRAAPPSSTYSAAASAYRLKTLAPQTRPPAGTPTPQMTTTTGPGAGGEGRSA